MAAYQVELTARARKQYTALDPVVRDRIRRTLLCGCLGGGPGRTRAAGLPL